MIAGTRPACRRKPEEAEPGADRLEVFANLSVHVVSNGMRPRPTTAGKDKTTMNDLTETTEMLNARLAAQTAITDTRDALLRTALALPNNLQYLADGGSFASTVVDLVRAIADARLAKNRAAIGYLRGTDADKARWDAECETATRREVAYVIERLHGIAGG